MNNQFQECYSDAQKNLHIEMPVEKFKKLLDKYNVLNIDITKKSTTDECNCKATNNKEKVLNALNEIKKETINLSEIVSTMHCINSDKNKIENLLMDILNDDSL